MDMFFNILFEIRSNLITILRAKEEDITISRFEEPEEVCLEGPWFLFSIKKTDKGIIDPILIFEIGTAQALLAETIRIVSTQFPAERFRIGKDYYFDPKEEVMHYGLDAYEKKKAAIKENMGEIQCAFCEEYTPTEYLDDTNFCPICKQDYEAKIIWH